MAKNKWDISLETFDNEFKLLFLCSGKDISPPKEEEIRSIIKDGVDWEAFLEIVKKHRIYPIVYKNLTKINNIDINEKALKNLEQQSQKNVMRSVKLTAELISLAKLMEQNGVRAFSLKGPLLAKNIYGDIALRKSKDLDILIPEQDVEKTGQLLLANGYKNTDLEIDLSPKQKAHIIKTNHHFVYKKPGGIIVELHWRYYSQLSDSQFNNLWLKRREQVLSGQSINVLSAEDEFIYLLIHGSIHGYTRLRWLCDIAEIIEKDELPWNEIIRRAEELDIMEILVQAVILSHKLLAINIPQLLLEPIAGNKLGQKLAMMAVPIIIETDEKDLAVDQPLNMYLRKYTLVRSKGIKAKLMYLLAMFYPGLADYEAINFGDRYFFMYYLTRPFFKIQRMMKNAK